MKILKKTNTLAQKNKNLVLLKKKQTKISQLTTSKIKKNSKQLYFSTKKNITIKSNKPKKKLSFKLKKKWKKWRFFKNFFLFKKKIKFFFKLQWRYNNLRILWHQLSKMYLPNIKKIIFNQLHYNNTKFCFFFKQLELRLSVLILRARFCYKLINAYNAIKFNLVLVNGCIVNRTWYLLTIGDLFQKRRTLKKNIYKTCRKIRHKWRKYRWKQGRYFLWKLRRISHFNMYFSRKQNTFLNYLEINYKIPAAIVLKRPFLKELYLNQQTKIISNSILKKIFFLY